MRLLEQSPKSTDLNMCGRCLFKVIKSTTKRYYQQQQTSFRPRHRSSKKFWKSFFLWSQKLKSQVFGSSAVVDGNCVTDAELLSMFLQKRLVRLFLGQPKYFKYVYVTYFVSGIWISSGFGIEGAGFCFFFFWCTLMLHEFERSVWPAIVFLLSFSSTLKTNPQKFYAFSLNWPFVEAWTFFSNY